MATQNLSSILMKDRDRETLWNAKRNTSKNIHGKFVRLHISGINTLLYTLVFNLYPESYNINSRTQTPDNISRSQE